MLWPPASRTVWHSQFYVCSLSVSHHWDASTMHHRIQSVLFTIEKSWLTKQCLGFGEWIEKNGKVDSWINETKLKRPEQSNGGWRGPWTMPRNVNLAQRAWKQMGGMSPCYRIGRESLTSWGIWAPGILFDSQCDSYRQETPPISQLRSPSLTPEVKQPLSLQTTF